MRAAAAYTLLAGVSDEIVVDPCFPQWADFLIGRWGADVESVLDVCCGTGLLADQLVQRGLRVIGVDASAEMLDRAAALLGPDVELTRATLPELPVVGLFDAAVSTFDGLNYLSPADFASTLQAVAGHLRPGGWLVFDLHTDAALRMIEENPVISGEDQGHRFTITGEVDRAARTCVTTITLAPADGGLPFRERHEQFVHGDDDVRTVLERSGFAEVQVLDEYTDRPADEGTLRATWVARKR